MSEAPDAQQPASVPREIGPPGSPTPRPTYQPGTVTRSPQIGIPASFLDRLGALIIDVLLSSIPLLVAVPIFLGLTSAAAGGESGNAGGDYGATSGAAAIWAAVVYLLGYLASWAIFVWNRCWRAGTTGQSVGRQAMGIVLIKKSDGAVLGFWLALGREVASSVINVAFYIADLWMLWDKDKQTLQDKIVSSRVVMRSSLPGWTPTSGSRPPASDEPAPYESGSSSSRVERSS